MHIVLPEGVDPYMMLECFHRILLEVSPTLLACRLQFAEEIGQKTRTVLHRRNPKTRKAFKKSVKN